MDSFTSISSIIFCYFTMYFENSDFSSKVGLVGSQVDEKNLFVLCKFVLKKDTKRDGLVERKRSSICCFISQMATMAEAKLIQSQKLRAFSRSPTQLQGPKAWAVLYCFPRSQAGSWVGSGTGRIQSGTQMGPQYVRGENFSTRVLCQAPA